mmetsp:Transcript_3457/g.9704  ORF Transcript_3457/g.9704 Transcript_3457/m.9704 type:complete len:922 (-) Transcript_3457:2125-4890(-)
MKAFRSKVANAAGRLKDGIERSVLADEPSGSGRRRGSKSTELSPEEEEENTYVRLPLEAAKRIRCFAKGDVGEIIARHLKEKEELLGEILALRDLCMKCAPNTEVKLLVDQSKAAKVVEVTRATNTAMVIAARDEIERLRKHGGGGEGGGSSASASASASKKIAALEWKLEELESEITMLREEAADFEQENATLQKEVSELKKAAKATATPSRLSPATTPPANGKRDDGEEENLPVDFDFFADGKSPGDLGKKVKSLEAKVIQMKQEFDLKSAECDASTARQQSQQRKTKEIQKQYKLLKEKQKQLSAALSAATEKKKDQENPKRENGEGSPVRLELNLDDGSCVMVEKLEHEIKEVNTAKNKMLEEKMFAEKEAETAHGKLVKQLKICKNQKAKIEKMQLDLAHAKDKARDVLKDFDQLVQEKKKVESALGKAKGEVDKKGGELEKQKKVQSDLADALKKIKEKTKEIESMKGLAKEKMDLEDELSSTKIQLEQSQQKDARNLEDVKEVQAANAKLEEELASAREEVVETRQQLAEASELLQAENGKLEDELALAREEVEGLRAKKEDQTDMMDNFCRLLVCEDRSTWSSSLAAAVNTVEQNARQKTSEELEASMDAMSAKVGELEEELEEKAKEIKTLNDKNSAEEDADREGDLEGEVSRLKDQLADSEAEVETQRQMVAEMTERLDESKLEKEQIGMEAAEVVNKELAEWKEKYDQISEELKSVRSRARMMMEAKDKELQASKARVMMEDSPVKLPETKLPEVELPEAEVLEMKLPETPVKDHPLPLAQDDESNGMQDLRAKLEEANKLVLSLQDALEDSERTHELRDVSEQCLKDEIKEMRRSEKRGNVDLTYVKNVLLKGFVSGELDPQSSLVTVLSRLLEFSPEELAKIPKHSRWNLLPQNLQLPQGLMSPLRKK